MSRSVFFVFGASLGLWLTRWLADEPAHQDVAIRIHRSMELGSLPPPSPIWLSSSSSSSSSSAITTSSISPEKKSEKKIAANAAEASSVSSAAAAQTASWSMGSVGPFDLDTRHGLRSAVAARAPHGEIATFTSNVKGLEAAANMALQLRRLRIEHHMVLADAEGTCLQGQARWAWLGCGWSVGLPGFEAKYARGSQASRDVARLWSLWSAKWLLVARLVELRVNVLALDTDMMLQSDPYPVLTSPPVSRFEMVIVPEGSRVNLGFLYVRGQCAPPAEAVAVGCCSPASALHRGLPLLDRRGRHSSTALIRASSLMRSPRPSPASSSTRTPTSSRPLLACGVRLAGRRRTRRCQIWRRCMWFGGETLGTAGYHGHGSSLKRSATARRRPQGARPPFCLREDTRSVSSGKALSSACYGCRCACSTPSPT